MKSTAKAITVLLSIGALAAAVVVGLSLGSVSRTSTVAAQTPVPRTITVVADGEVRGQPDVAYLSLGVQTSGSTAKEAMEENSRLMNAVLAKLEALGIPKKDIQTMGLSLYPIYAPPKGGEMVKAEQVSGYRASNSLNVTIGDVSRAAEILDGALAAGANTAGGVRFAIKDEAKLRNQALEEAVKAARPKAEIIARALGVKVTGVASITEASYGGPIAPRAMAVEMGGGPIEPGELTISVRVTVSFDFQ
ncbi:MAG: SIMPL domain-containing protein [Chloroflexota bacterium]